MKPLIMTHGKSPSVASKAETREARERTRLTGFVIGRVFQLLESRHGLSDPHHHNSSTLRSSASVTCNHASCPSATKSLVRDPSQKVTIHRTIHKTRQLCSCRVTRAHLRNSARAERGLLPRSWRCRELVGSFAPNDLHYAHPGTA